MVLSKLFNKGISNAYTFNMKVFSTSSIAMMRQHKIVIAGGGTGGITMASRILRMGEKDVAVIEPSKVHYYQPYWTLVGGGKKTFESSYRSTASVMPSKAVWIQDTITGFNPSSNIVHTKKSGDVCYEILIVALGIKVAYEKIKGLSEALETPGVCSNYSPLTVKKTVNALKNFNGGNAIFTQPVNPIKCGGAPQKIMYLAEEYLTKNEIRSKANIYFNTALDVMFACPKYSTVLEKVAQDKGIFVNYFHDLIEIKPEAKEAVFGTRNSEGTSKGLKIFKYDMIHVTPPMVAPDVIKESVFSGKSGFMEVDKNSLQSTKFDNVFGIGDCTSIPTSKTAAAVASQCGVLTENISRKLKGKPLSKNYFGYTSCPLVTGYNKGVLAEFNYDLLPEETLPFDQGKERYLSYFLKADVMPFLYWSLMLKGYWSGPKYLRKFLHLGFA